MKRFLSVIALTCLLAASVQAGDLHTPGFTATSPGQLPTGGVTSTSPTETTSAGDFHTPGFAEEVSNATLSALMMALAW